MKNVILLKIDYISSSIWMCERQAISPNGHQHNDEKKLVRFGRIQIKLKFAKKMLPRRRMNGITLEIELSTICSLLEKHFFLANSYLRILVQWYFESMLVRLHFGSTTRYQEISDEFVIAKMEYTCPYCSSGCISINTVAIDAAIPHRVIRVIFNND